jgi:hypothetical protein
MLLDDSGVDLDAPPLSLLTTGNPKTAKGEGFGYLTAILHLSPEAGSGAINVCPHASAGCTEACLNTAGRGGIGLDEYGLNRIQEARIKRTRFFARDRAGFMVALTKEIRAHSKRAANHGLQAAVRLNGTSDIPWEKMAVHGEPNVFGLFPEVRFYDYTKWPVHLRDGERWGYHLTFSLSEDNQANAEAALRANVNVAVVFGTRKSEPLPLTYRLGDVERNVLDGDRSDLRFLDGQSGSIVGLRAKGRAKGSDTGFVRRPA